MNMTRIVTNFKYIYRAMETAEYVEKILDASPKHLDKKSKKILVVDDNTLNQVLICKSLYSLGYKPDIASDGIEAVKACRLNNYDLILMDFNMPNLNGADAAKKIRKLEYLVNHPKRRSSIVGITSDPDLNNQCIKSGMDEVCNYKPFRRDSLEQIINKWIINS